MQKKWLILIFHHPKPSSPLSLPSLEYPTTPNGFPLYQAKKKKSFVFNEYIQNLQVFKAYNVLFLLSKTLIFYKCTKFSKIKLVAC